MKSKKRIFRKVLSIFIALTITLSSVPLSFAAEVNMKSTLSTVEVPENAMQVNSNIITASAHAEAALLPEILGCNVISGYSIVGNSAPSDLEAACNEPMMVVWGTEYNKSPDPYIWNYFYNYKALKSNLKLSNQAVINPVYPVDRKSASKADEHLCDMYGGISASISARPDILIGCGLNSGDYLQGYISQIDKIRKFGKDSEFYCDGDGNYSPHLVGYNGSSLDSAIKSMYRAARAINHIAEETGKKTRYGNPEDIANLYQAYIYGFKYYLISKINSGEICKKTVAVVTEACADGTFKLSANPIYNKELEYFFDTADNFALRYSDTDYKVTVDELRMADTIILTSIRDDIEKNMAREIIESSNTAHSDDMMIICDMPKSMSSSDNCSIEDAAYFVYCNTEMYREYFGNEYMYWYAWFLEKFYHAADIKSLYKFMCIDDKLRTVDVWKYYTQVKINNCIAEGIAYYNKYYSKYNNNEKIYVPVLGINPPADGAESENVGADRFEKNSKKQQQKQKESFASKLYSRFFADPVDTLTGAHQIDLSYLTQSGAIDLQYDIHYDSSRLSKGRLGTGWYDSYEKKIEEKSDGTLLYYSSPTSYLEFELESSAAGSYSCSSPGRTS